MYTTRHIIRACNALQIAADDKTVHGVCNAVRAMPENPARAVRAFIDMNGQECRIMAHQTLWAIHDLAREFCIEEQAKGNPLIVRLDEWFYQFPTLIKLAIQLLLTAGVVGAWWFVCAFVMGF